jgi:hypothetical protein
LSMTNIDFNRKIKKDLKTTIINLSGPPSVGKTTLSKILKIMFLRNNIKCVYSSFTGFHYVSFLFSKTLYILFKLFGKITPLCKGLMITKVNLFDCVPSRYLKPLLRFIYCLEIISLYNKLLNIFLKAMLLRPKIVLIDEGFPHLMFYYTLFYYFRGSTFYRSLNKHLFRSFIKLTRHFNVKIIFILPSIDYAINNWRKRDPYIPKYMILNWLRMYYTFIWYYIKLFKALNVNVLIFNNSKHAIHYILKDLHESYDEKT